MALSAERNTLRRSGDLLTMNVAASAVIYAGALVVRDASGNAAPGTATTGLLGVGRASETVNNTGGAAGAKTVTVEKGIFLFANSTGDAVANSNIGSSCYIEDDQTVCITSSGKSVAGKVHYVETAGVWVDMR